MLDQLLMENCYWIEQQVCPSSEFIKCLQLQIETSIVIWKCLKKVVVEDTTRWFPPWDLAIAKLGDSKSVLLGKIPKLYEGNSARVHYSFIHLLFPPSRPHIRMTQERAEHWFFCQFLSNLSKYDKRYSLRCKYPWHWKLPCRLLTIPYVIIRSVFARRILAKKAPGKNKLGLLNKGVKRAFTKVRVWRCRRGQYSRLKPIFIFVACCTLRIERTESILGQE